MNNNHNSKNKINSYYAGALSGIAQVAVGYPFDTLKVRIQNQKSLSNLKITDYYRGVSFPIINGAIINSFVFGSQRFFKQYTSENLISGFLAGSTISPLVFIFDIGKTKNQISNTPKLNMIFRNKGFFTCFLRESFAYSTYFTTYYYLKENLECSILVSGGIAGLANWTLTYPIDVIKNRQIASDITIKDAFHMGNFYKGYLHCAVRAMLVNSFGFYIYEFLLNNLNS